MASVDRESVRNDGNKYCGPAVLSVITGMTTSEIANEINKESISNRARSCTQQSRI
jgi:hypothetical protein